MQRPALQQPPAAASPPEAPRRSQVENVALLANATDNDFTGVNMYCDDEAEFVQAPLNPRASEIAACCGRALQARAGRDPACALGRRRST
jgi:hypothetical protein